MRIQSENPEYRRQLKKKLRQRSRNALAKASRDANRGK